MDQIIAKISEIEKKTAAIVEEGNGAKKEIAARVREEEARFDLELKAETDKRIREARGQMNLALEEKLNQLREETERELAQLSESYEKHREQWLSRLFLTVTGEG